MAPHCPAMKLASISSKECVAAPSTWVSIRIHHLGDEGGQPGQPATSGRRVSAIRGAGDGWAGAGAFPVFPDRIARKASSAIGRSMRPPAGPCRAGRSPAPAVAGGQHADGGTRAVEKYSSDSARPGLTPRRSTGALNGKVLPSRSAARAAARPTWPWPAAPTRASWRRRWSRCRLGWRSGPEPEPAPDVIRGQPRRLMRGSRPKAWLMAGMTVGPGPGTTGFFCGTPGPRRRARA